eukprot:TRINITY_DN23071_c0_g1_i1.p1 TRINITY_DN23071_c0_g1~~TRINITY_DN23071_c0_g1_i1.p1  ORF type:complete len:242 (-),score=30.78 TRINITY_DN23071_c0_g1_i1:157-882(-)
MQLPTSGNQRFILFSVLAVGAMLISLTSGVFGERFMLFKADMRPHMDRNERELFMEQLAKATNYLEFGGGGSTVAALSFPNIKHIHTVESAAKWINILKNRTDISKAVASGRLVITDAGIQGNKSNWGWPTTPRETWPYYSGEAAIAEESQGLFYDTIFVDGRFRVACFLRQLKRHLHLAPDAVRYIVHDYFQRPEYFVVEKFVIILRRASSLGIFRRRKQIDEAELDKTIETYLYDPYRL